MYIDSHQHFWIYDAVRDAWIDDSMPVLRRNFLPDDLKPILTENNINGCVAVQADQSETETLFLLNLAVKYDFVKGVVGWVDLCSDKLGERLQFFSSYKKLRGLRHIVQAEPDDRFLLRPEFQRGIRKLGEAGFTYDILVYPKQLPAVAEFVARFPNQKFVIDHMAKPGIKNKQTADWEKYIRAIGTHEQVHCKISGMVTEADWENWKPDDFTYYLDVILEAFGSHRVMYGSDWPVCLLAASYQEQLAIVKSYISSLSNDEQDCISGLNAKNFYQL